MPLYNEDIDTPVPARCGGRAKLSRPRGMALLLGKFAAVLVAGYHVGEAGTHLDHVLAKAGARVVAAAGRVISIKSLGGAGAR
jgi:hypothetical protein